MSAMQTSMQKDKQAFKPIFFPENKGEDSGDCLLEFQPLARGALRANEVEAPYASRVRVGFLAAACILWRWNRSETPGLFSIDYRYWRITSNTTACVMSTECPSICDSDEQIDQASTTSNIKFPKYCTHQTHYPFYLVSDIYQAVLDLSKICHYASGWKKENANERKGCRSLYSIMQSIKFS